MAVATLRPGLTLWVAWVAAAGIGTAVSAFAAQPGAEIFQLPDSWFWVPTIVVAAPVALLQFLVLRGLLGASRGVAGLWVVVTVAVSLANLWATLTWYSQILPSLSLWAFRFGEAAQDLVFRLVDYAYPLLLGLAQGVLLARLFGHRWVVGLWVVVNLLADVVSLYAISAALSALHIDDYSYSSASFVLRPALLAAYAAITGFALVALTLRRPVRAPAPAARLPQAPTP